MSKEEKKNSYALVILRRDGDHINVLETDNYDKVYELYRELTTRWSSCIQDKKPFHLMSPIITSFDPGLIYEVTIKPIVETIGSNRYDNPYHQAMRKQGFQNTFGNPDVLSEIKDGGYR